ncbi:MAG: DnaJ domain-containing protein [Hyphomicrobiaceae bacterium]
MHALLLGFAALVILLFFLHSFASANTGQVARQIRLGVGTILIAIAIALASRGAAAYAFPIGTFGLWLLFRSGGGRRSVPSSGQTSQVRTDHLEMELDLETGAMHGRVLKGVFAGREIERMAPAELALLWQDCRFEDPQSAQLIEAYLDRIHATWREDMSRAESEAGAGGFMTPEEAYNILGLEPGASAEDIRRAHRDLMKKLHPDRGGSSYLATKINEAKDLLLQNRT